LGYILLAECVGVYSTTFTQWALKAKEFAKITQTTRPLRRSRSFKVTDFVYQSKAMDRPMRLPISD